MGALQEDSAAETTDAGSDTESVSTITSSCAGDSASIANWRVVGSNRAPRQAPLQSVTNPMRRRARFSGTPLQTIPASPCGEESLSPVRRLGASLGAPSPKINRNLASPSRRSRLGRVPETQTKPPSAVEAQPSVAKPAPEPTSVKLSKRKRRQKQAKNEARCEDSVQKQSGSRCAASGRPDNFRNITPAPASARPLPVGPVRAQPERPVQQPPPLQQPVRLPPGLEALGPNVPLPKQDQRAALGTSIMATSPVAPVTFPPRLPPRTAPAPALSFPPCPPPAYPPSQAGGRMCKGVLSTDPLPKQLPGSRAPVAPVTSPPQQGPAASHVREGIIAQARRDGLPLKVREPMNGAVATRNQLKKDLPAKKRPVFEDDVGQAEATKVPLDPNLPLKLRISEYLFEETELQFDAPATWAKPSSR